MIFLVKVRVDTAKLAEFGAKLQGGTLSREAIRSDTYCLDADPAVGYSVWEAEDEADFARRFASWRVYYSEAEIRRVVPPMEAMARLMKS
jgi:hypothetical protein